jgi:hypothetical protein
MSEANRTEDQKVTVWYRDIGKGLVFNHISDGYDIAQIVPVPVNEHQRKAWKGSLWDPRRACLRNGVLYIGGPVG